MTRGEQFAQTAGTGLTKLGRSSHGTASRTGQHPVSSRCLGGICLSQTWSSSSRAHVLRRVRTRRGGVLCIKTLQTAPKMQRKGLAVGRVHTLSALAVSGGGSSPGLPRRLTSASVPGAILQLPPCSHKVKNDQGKRWRQGPSPLTSKKMYWAGCFQQAEVSFQCAFSSCLFTKKKLSAGQQTWEVFHTSLCQEIQGDDSNGNSACLASH